MTSLREFAQSIVNDPQYRDTVTARARAGTLPEEIELFLLELADGRVSPMAADRAPTSAQSRTLALIRPSASTREEVQS
jgi:hypothetical protein